MPSHSDWAYTPGQGGQVVGEYLSICKVIRMAFQGPTFYCLDTSPNVQVQLWHFKKH